MWKTIDSKKVFDHPRLTLYEDDVELPNGAKTKYIYRKDKGNAVSIIAKKEGKILVQKEFSYPPREMLYQWPGGGVPFDEAIQEGANRELMEEAGYKAKNLELLGKYLINSRRSTAQMYVFLATDLIEDKLPEDETEIIEHYWFTEEEIDKMIEKGEIVNAHMLASWSIYNQCKNNQE